MIRKALRAVSRAIYQSIAMVLAQLSLVARMLAVLSPDFFWYFRGEDAAANAALSPELHFFRLVLVVTLSFLFVMYFVWDALAVAGRPSKKYPHVTGQDWDRAKAAMDDDDASMMGTSAWMQRRARQISAGELPKSGRF